MELTGQKLSLRLEASGSRYVFGIPAGANLPMFDKFYDSGYAWF